MEKFKFFMLLIGLTTIPFFAQVKNPDKPQKGNWDFKIQKMWEIENTGEDVLGIVQNIVTAKDGRVYIADSKNFKTYIFSKDGKFISAFGPKGEGPGEIKKYGKGDQLFEVNGSIIFADPGKLHYFSLEGQYKKSILISSSLKPRAFISEDVFFSVPLTINDTNKKEVNIVMYNINDKSEKTITSFLPSESSGKEKMTEKGQLLKVLVEAPNVIPKMMLATGNGKVVYGMSDSYRINILDLKNKENIDFTIEDRTREKVPDKFKKDLTKALEELPPEMSRDIINAVPEKVTFYQHISIDGNGMIYAFVSVPVNTNHQSIDIFSPKGIYLYSSKFEVEDGLEINPDFIYQKDNRLILVVEDKEGNVKVIKYTLKLPVL